MSGKNITDALAGRLTKPSASGIVAQRRQVQEELAPIATTTLPNGHTTRLVAAFRPGVVTERDFPGTGHNGVSASPAYLEAIADFLR